MKVKGIIRGVLRDINTGEITRTFECENHVQNHMFRTMSDIYTSTADKVLGVNIFAAEDNFGEQRRDIDYVGRVEVGVDVPGISSPVVSYDQPGDMHVLEYQQRFSPPISDRTINTIGITRDTPSSTNVTSYDNVKAQAWVHLTTPCIQTTTESLDVFYRIQWLYVGGWSVGSLGINSNGLNPLESKNLAGYTFGELSYPVRVGVSDGLTKYNYASYYTQKWNPRRKNTTTITNANNEIKSAVLSNGLDDADYYRGKVRFTVDLNDAIGKQVGTLHNNYHMYGRTVFGTQAFSPIQNVYGHSSTAVSPFYDTNNLQTGSATMTFDGSGWTNPDYNKLLQVNVTTTGGIGNGTYQIQQRNSMGYALNTYDNIYSQIFGFSNSNSHYTDGFTIAQSTAVYTVRADSDRIATMIKYDGQTVVAGAPTEICIANVISAEGKRFAVDTIPSLPVTNVGQFEVDKTTGDVYVACRLTGAYKLSANQLVVTTFNSTTTGLSGTTGCMAINVGFGGRLWAYFAGSLAGLYHSDDSGTSWIRDTFSFSVLTENIDADPTKVIALKVDRNEANHHIGIQYTQDPGSIYAAVKICWWDAIGVVAPLGVAAPGPVIFHAIVDVDSTFTAASGRTAIYSEPVTYFNIFECSDNQSFWAAAGIEITYGQIAKYPAKFTFGSVVIDQPTGTRQISSSQFQTSFGVDENGNDALIYLSNQDATQDYVIALVMFRSDLTRDFEKCSRYLTDNRRFAERVQCYLGDGVFISHYGSSSFNGRLQEVNILTAYPMNDPTGGLFANELLPTYGWDGTNWIKGNAGSKPFHATQEVTLDGITVGFDDALGVDTFVATDYYTVGVCDGIWLDGATTFDHTVIAYTKPITTGQTDISDVVLPTSPQSPPYMIPFIPIGGQLDWQDVVGMDGNSAGSRYINGSSLADVYSFGSRSLLPAINGNVISTPNSSTFDRTAVTNVQGAIEWKIDQSSIVTYVSQYAVGLSKEPVLPDVYVLDPNNIDFCIKYDSELEPGTNTGGLVIMEKGVVKATFSAWPGYSTGLAASPSILRIIIQTDGSVVYEGYHYKVGWSTFYTSPPGTATLGNYYFDAAFAGQNNFGIEDIRYFSATEPGDYITLGNGVNTGISQLDFSTIDNEDISVIINGTAALQVGINDSITVLNVGEYVLFPETGVIRYSIPDRGNTISVTYSVISHS